MLLQKRHILLVTALVLACLTSNSVATTAQLDKKEKKEEVPEHAKEGGVFGGLFHLMPQHQQWGWLAPPSTLLSRYWHMSPFTSPTYELEVDDKNFELTYDIAGYSTDEISVELNSHTHLLHIKGEHKAAKQGKEKEDEGYKSVSTTKFYHTFYLDPNVHSEKVKAEINGAGHLIITVPRKLAPPTRTIPIATTSNAARVES